MDNTERREKIAQMSQSIFQYCLSRTSSYQESEDLSQEIILALFESIENLRDEKAFYGFIWRTADNILKGWYRGRDKRHTSELDEAIPDNCWEKLEEQAYENEQLRLMTRELSLLNSSYRRVMVAYYVDGLSVRDISGKFSLSQSMVKYLLFQSRKRIQEGVNMERTFGELSYKPVSLELVFWGGKNNYWGKFDSRLRQNIMMACYYSKQNEEQIALQLGVPTAYLEDAEIRKANNCAVKSIAESIRSAVDEMMDKVRSIGFYGSDMPDNRLRWMLTSLILHLAYIDMSMGEQPLDFPTDVFGDECFRFFAEKSPSDPYSVGTSVMWSDYGMILFWDVLINGERLHPYMTNARVDMLCSLVTRQPETDTEKLVCAELVKHGLAVHTDEGIKPNFPCFTREQGDELNDIIQSTGHSICQDILSRADSVRDILIDHTPSHLSDYVSKMALLLFYRETEEVTQSLCESGWLLPMKDGMSATTVMYLK